MRKYVVLGCGGFVGSHFLDKVLENEDIHITGWDLSDAKILQHLEKRNFDFHLGDLRNAYNSNEFLEAVEASDAVIHLAAICNPAEYNKHPVNVIRVNFIESYPIVDVCARFRKWLIFYSTSEVYGRTVSSYVDDDYTNKDLYLLDELRTPLIMGPTCNQRWSYASAKQLLERYIYGQHKEFGLPFTVVRPLNFFGPRMDFIPGYDGEGVPRVLACFISALFNREPMKLVEGGYARRTITAINDAIEALCLMIDSPLQAQNHIFNVGNPENEVTIRQLAHLMRDIYAEISGDASYKTHPIIDVSGYDFYGEGYEDCDRRVPSIELIKKQLGWSPKISLRETLYETVSYYHSHYEQKTVLRASCV